MFTVAAAGAPGTLPLVAAVAPPALVAGAALGSGASSGWPRPHAAQASSVVATIPAVNRRITGTRLHDPCQR
jgi:hypothetical protein